MTHDHKNFVSFLVLYVVPPAKNSILPVVRKSKMRISRSSVYADNSGRVKSPSIEAFRRDPLSLWCRAQPEYGFVFERFTVCNSTERNSCPFIARYDCRDGNAIGIGYFSNLARICVFGIPEALALKQAEIKGFVNTDGIKRKNFNSSTVNSSHNHFPKKNRTIVPNFPEEIIRKRSDSRVSRFSDTVILKVLKPPLWGKFDDPEWLFNIKPLNLISMTSYRDRPSPSKEGTHYKFQRNERENFQSVHRPGS